MNTKLLLSFCLLIFGVFSFLPKTFAQVTDRHNVVRLIYFVPRHRQPQPNIDAKLDRLIKDVQRFFADEIERHGFGRKTFQFETDGRGNAVVHRVTGNFPDTYYHQDTASKVVKEVSPRFDFTKNVYLLIVDVSSELIDSVCGRGGEFWNTAGDWGGHAFIPASGECLNTHLGFELTAHELGHAFGLPHNFTRNAYIMSYGQNPDQLAHCSAEWLNTNRYFNDHRTPSNNHETTIQMLALEADPDYTFRFRFKISDTDGLRHSQLVTPATSIYEDPGSPKLIGCKELEGDSQSVEFITNQLSLQSELITLRVVDALGNFSWQDYPIDISDLLPAPRVVSIPDVNLAAAIRSELGLRRFINITQLDMLKLTALSAENQQIKDLTGLAHARNLKYLFLSQNQIKDIAILENLPNLAVLSLSFNQINDFTSIARLTKLIELDLSENPGNDIRPVTKLTQLQTLYLSGYRIQDLTPFARFTNLLRLGLEHNQIRDLTPLAELTQLRNLRLWDNQIQDLTPLTELINLEWLELSENRISNLTPLKSLTQLQVLQLSSNQIDDLTPLSKFKNLTHLTLVGNQIGDITPLSALTNLEVLVANHNQIRDLTPLTTLRQLTTLWLTNNQVSNLKPLTKLRSLVELRVAQNPIADRTPLHVLLKRNSRLKLDIDPTQLSPIVLFSGAGYPPMYWTDTATSGFYRLVGTKETVENNAQGIQNIIALAVDVDGGKLYWIEQKDKKHGRIVRANLDGSNVQVVKQLLYVPRDIAIDTANKGIYCTNPNGKIQRINFNGSNFKANLVTNLDTPNHIALDVPGGKFYWTEKGESIRRANLDGSNIETLVTDLGALGGITIAADKLYWTEHTSENTGNIRSANLDGANVQTLATLKSLPLGIAVDTAGRKLYWTNATGRIQRANLNGKNIQNVVTGLSNPIDLVLGMDAATVPVAAAPAAVLPDATDLLPNYPNPFNPETWIPYQLAKPADVILTIYAMDGQLIRTLALGHKSAGLYQTRSRAAYWDGKNEFGEKVASSIYFYTLSAGDFTATRKMLIVK